MESRDQRWIFLMYVSKMSSLHLSDRTKLLKCQNSLTSPPKGPLKISEDSFSRFTMVGKGICNIYTRPPIKFLTIRINENTTGLFYMAILKFGKWYMYHMLPTIKCCFLLDSVKKWMKHFGSLPIKGWSMIKFSWWIRLIKGVAVVKIYLCTSLYQNIKLLQNFFKFLLLLELTYDFTQTWHEPR